MTDIITTTEVQQKIGFITSSIGSKMFIVTNRGKAKMVMLPYFSGCDELMEDYMEDFEMYMNREKVQKEMEESKASGISDLVI